QEELAAAGRSANEAMVLLEDSQLGTLRQFTFTDGVAAAIAAGQSDQLKALLGPIAANDRSFYVDVFNADGRELLALRSSDAGPDSAGRIDPAANEWAPVRSVLDGVSDAQGDKQAGVVTAPWGSMFVVVAPVHLGSASAGAIALSL